MDICCVDRELFHILRIISLHTGRHTPTPRWEAEQRVTSELWGMWCFLCSSILTQDT